MHEAAVMAEFDSWFFDNGGDEDLLDLLKSNGFYSKLSLANLDLTSPDAVTLMDSINYGQKCLLRGLVSKLCSSEKEKTPYSSGATTATALSNTSSSLKDKISKMFKFNGTLSSDVTASSSKDVSQVEKRASKRKAPTSRKGPFKKKVKQMRIKIIALPKMMRHTPTAANRSRLTYHVWLNRNASEEEIREKIADEIGWTDGENMKFLYAQGKNLREAELSDIENADCWDMDTLRALMGRGALYVCNENVGADDPHTSTDMTGVVEQNSVVDKTKKDENDFVSFALDNLKDVNIFLFFV